ncbi:hypothetical protein BV22DRAFT_1038288 [Leucogyrophana mollusca]|uniref:Uncharacterized protein n=1 Tax=Leucogyrophana mollusca TaxID=85980 RepID=A0ACB8B7V5_9AGAM|nr:hypothetical protein BV22DRAFT_1038288 [Leucogyrophana mollusca]
MRVAFIVSALFITFAVASTEYVRSLGGALVTRQDVSIQFLHDVQIGILGVSIADGLLSSAAKIPPAVDALTYVSCSMSHTPSVEITPV